MSNVSALWKCHKDADASSLYLRFCPRLPHATRYPPPPMQVQYYIISMCSAITIDRSTRMWHR
jgi:hypothetical protein